MATDLEPLNFLDEEENNKSELQESYTCESGCDNTSDGEPRSNIYKMKLTGSFSGNQIYQ